MTADFWRAVARSAAHILGGFLLSCALAVVLAALAARLRRVEELLAPLVAAIKAVPVASFIILALVWLSSRSLTLFISALMVFPPVYLSTLEGHPPHRQAASRDGAGLPRAAFAAAGGDLCAAGAALLPLRRERRARPVLEGRHRGGGHRPERRHDPAERLYTAKVYFQTPDLFAWTAVIVLISALFEKLFLFAVDRLAERVGA